MIKPISHTCEIAAQCGNEDYTILKECSSISVAPYSCESEIYGFSEDGYTDPTYWQVDIGTLVGVGHPLSSYVFSDVMFHTNRTYEVTVDIEILGGVVQLLASLNGAPFDPIIGFTTSGQHTFQVTGYDSLLFLGNDFEGTIQPIEIKLLNEVEVNHYVDCTLNAALTPEPNNDEYEVKVACGQLGITQLCGTGTLAANYSDMTGVVFASLECNEWLLGDETGTGKLEYYGTAGKWYRICFEYVGDGQTIEIYGDGNFIREISEDGRYCFYFQGDFTIDTQAPSDENVKIIGVKIYCYEELYTRAFCDTIPEDCQDKLLEVSFGKCDKLDTYYFKSKLEIANFVDSEFEVYEDDCGCPTVLGSIHHNIYNWSILGEIPIDVAECLAQAPKNQNFLVNGKHYVANSAVPSFALSNGSVSQFTYQLIECGTTIKCN